MAFIKERWRHRRQRKDTNLQIYLIRIPEGANRGGIVAENLLRLTENMNSQIEETGQFPSRQVCGNSYMILTS